MIAQGTGADRRMEDTEGKMHKEYHTNMSNNQMSAKQPSDVAACGES